MNLLLPGLVLFPIIGGLLIAVLRPKRAAVRNTIVTAALLIEACLTVLLLTQQSLEMQLFSMTDILTAALRLDGVSKVFAAIAAFGFLAAGFYAFRYIPHVGRENGFFTFFLLAQGALMGMDLSANLTTMYLFFELVTLMSVPLVIHERSKEAAAAALKYLFYSVSGAFLALCCMFFLSQYCTTTEFVAGGSLSASAVKGKETLLQIVIFLGVVGFSAKAGMYPLHGWLPTAHPVAPAPASAVLSGIIAKAGVLAVLRIVYFSVGPEFLRGTWVQAAWLGLALLTVFMGSMMAYRENAFKKRLAYSSVSQISYILVGLFLLTPNGVTGALLHVVFHAAIKICLFLIAGAFIVVLNKHRVDELRGAGRAMPLTFGAFTLASVALVGIPPASGFVSKWYLALGALDSGLPVFTWLAPAILLISALLTAAYLFPITIDAYFPGKDAKLPARTNEGGAVFLAPICVLGVLTLLLGVFSGPLVAFFSQIAELIAA